MSRKNNIITYLNKLGYIRLRLPSCHPGIESQAHHLRFFQFKFEFKFEFK